MRTSILSLVCGLCLLGCSPDAGPSDQKTASVNDTGSTGTTGADADTAGDTAGDTGEPEVPLDADFVMDSVRLLPSSQGFDLNGDGEPDNALSLLFENELIGDALGGSPNGYIADSVARGELLVMLDEADFLGPELTPQQARIRTRPHLPVHRAADVLRSAPCHPPCRRPRWRRRGRLLPSM